MPWCSQLEAQHAEDFWNVPGRDLNPISLMTYSHDGYGLGHLRRSSTLAASIVQQMPHASVLMLVGCPVGAFFELPPGVDFIKVPSIIKVAAGLYEPFGIRVGVKKTKMLRASTIATAAEVLQPDVLLVDHVPTGVWDELLPTLHKLKASKSHPWIVLGLRDIIDAPDVVRELWQREGTYKAINTYYDDVLIYGCQDVFDAAMEYGLYDEVQKKITYCGYVCSQRPHKSKSEMRQDLGITKDKLVLVTAGGGHDGYPMMQACMNAFQLIGKDPPFETIFVAGPLMEHDFKKFLRGQGAELNIRVLSHVHESLGYLEAADLVITMAGYNSMSEILNLKKKALVIPREGPRVEQRTRSRIFAEREIVDVLYANELSPKKLAARIMANLTDSSVQGETGIDTGGANYVARLFAERTRHRARAVHTVVNGGAEGPRLPLASPQTAQTAP